MAAALLTVLVLNISVSTAQYQLVQLKAEAATLNKENQDLTQKKQNFEAPQNLAAKAAELGMVPSTVKGQIDLNTMTVTGKATPAVKGDAPLAQLAPPAVAGMLDVVPSVTTKDPLENLKPVTPVAPAPLRRLLPKLRRHRQARLRLNSMGDPSRPPSRRHPGSSPSVH